MSPILVAAMLFANCGPTTDVLANLLAKYDEKPAFTAAMPDGAVLTITTSAAGTWTALSQHTADIICVIAVGEAWAVAPPSLSDPPAVKPADVPVPKDGI